MSQVIQSEEMNTTYNKPIWQCNYKPNSREQMDGETVETVHKARLGDFFLARVKRDGEFVIAMFVVWTTPNRKTVYERVEPVADFEDFDSCRMDSVINGLQVASDDLQEDYWLNNMSIIPSRQTSLEEVVVERLSRKLNAVLSFTATLDEDTELSEVEVPKSTLWKSRV
jgi:hypothetical protein